MHVFRNSSLRSPKAGWSSCFVRLSASARGTRCRTRRRRREASARRGSGFFDEFKRSSPQLQVSFDTHQIPKGGRITRDVELRNVLAILPGRTPRRIYVSGHYDTVNLGNQGQAGLNTAGGGYGTPADNADAPGADDDGSGTVLVMELARVFAESGIDVRRHARVHGGGGRRAGSHRRARSTPSASRPRTFPSRPSSTTTSSAARWAATALSTARRSVSTRTDPRTRRHGRLRFSCSAWPRATCRRIACG